MDKIIVQTFWTKPMDDNNFDINLDLAKISLFYLHKNGYKVHMYTDSKGIKFLQDYGYDKLTLDLDNIPEDIPTCMFAYPKIIALEKEELGTIHIDLDVFIKKPCLDIFFKNKKIDVILQCKEEGYLYFYEVVKQNIEKVGVSKDLCVDYTKYGPNNVGIIGFNNKELKEQYIKKYKSCSQYYKKFKIDMIDLFFEQINISYLIKNYNYNVFYLLGNTNYLKDYIKINKLANKIGYQHLQGGWKHSKKGKDIIKKYKSMLLNNT